ncbi:MAG: glycosyltransferase [Spirochaetaceae bacterium]
MINILHVNTYLDKAGAAKSTMELSSLLNNDEDYNSTVLVGFSEKKSDRTLYNIFTKYINAMFTRITGWDSLFYPIQSRKRIKREISKADIIHLHNLHGYFIDWIWLLKEIQKQGKKVVWTLRDSWLTTGRCCVPLDCNGYVNGCNNCPDLNKYPKVFIDKASKMYNKKLALLNSINISLITISESSKNLLKKGLLKDFDISVIYNGFSEEKYIVNRKFTENDFNILFIASDVNNPGKGIKYLLNALLDLKLSNTTIHIVGNKIDNEVVNKYLGSYEVIQYGYIKDQIKLGEIYNRSDVYINPSLSETFGRTSIEAFYHGIPVISFDIPIMREILSDLGYFAKEKDINDLKSKILEVKNTTNDNPTKYINRANIFSSKIMVEKYKKIYGGILLDS